MTGIIILVLLVAAIVARLEVTHRRYADSPIARTAEDRDRIRTADELRARP